MKNTLTLRHRSDLSPHYFSILENMHPLLKRQKQRRILLVPFVLTCAATLECLLNDRLIQHCLNTYGSGEYKRYADRLTGLSVRAKLDFVVPLLSGDRYAIRSDSATYGHLTAMISLRNSLTHNKSFLKDYEAEIIEVEFDGTPLIAYPSDSSNRSQLQISCPSNLNRIMTHLWIWTDSLSIPTLSARTNWCGGFRSLSSQRIGMFNESEESPWR